MLGFVNVDVPAAVHCVSPPIEALFSCSPRQAQRVHCSRLLVTVQFCHRLYNETEIDCTTPPERRLTPQMRDRLVKLTLPLMEVAQLSKNPVRDRPVR